jgi:hypothetical protein
MGNTLKPHLHLLRINIISIKVGVYHLVHWQFTGNGQQSAPSPKKFKTAQHSTSEISGGAYEWWGVPFHQQHTHQS